MKTKFKTIVAVMVIAISFVAFQSFKSIQKENNSVKKEVPTQIIKYSQTDNNKCGGAKKDNDAKADKKEGKCGEGKCGDGKAKKGDAKCGNGKCGDGKAKKENAKCGTGKCGKGK